MKKSIVLLIAAIFCLSVTSMALARERITELTQLAEKKIAVPKGTLADSFVLAKFPKAQLVYFEDTQACIEALRASSVDAVAYDEPVLRSFLRNSTDLAILEQLIRKDTYAIAINPKRRDLVALANKKIDVLRQSRRLEQMSTYWFPSAGDFPAMPKQEWNVKGKKELTLATFPQVVPFSFKDANNAVIGYDIELAGYLAQELGARLVIKEMAFEQLIPSVANGTADIAAACITVTPERAKLVHFSEAYYAGGIAAMVKK
jgi:polar amino acid transport system substrate-binding protein